MTSAFRGTPYFRRYDGEVALKPAISSKKSRGGYRRTTRHYRESWHHSNSTIVGPPPHTDSRVHGPVGTPGAAPPPSRAGTTTNNVLLQWGVSNTAVWARPTYRHYRGDACYDRGAPLFPLKFSFLIWELKTSPSQKTGLEQHKTATYRMQKPMA